MALPLSRPLSDWPLLLCGPILRRVTPTHVAVFVALKSRARLVLELYKRTSPSSYDTPMQGIGQDTVALGANLHVCLVEWRRDPPAAPLAANQIYGYDLLITVPGANGKRLGDLTPNLLAGPYRLGYDERLPSFVLPPLLRDLVVVHGSCRKPHGNAPHAGADAMAIVDQLIGSEFTSPLRRPHHLFLTGDQIYADDVSVALLSTLRATASDLLGWATDETFPAPSGGGAAIAPADPQVQPGPKRREYISRQTKLSSGPIDGHLMFLGEFYAMYLFAWSDELWPRATGIANPGVRLPEAQELRPAIYPGLQALGGSAKDYLAGIDAARTNVHAFAQTLPQVRRALANVPVMTMFDDHEVTDDWYLHAKWTNDVRADPASRQIVRNALAAYAVFQDWGNRPDDYHPGGRGRDILDALTFVQASRMVPIESQPALLDVVMDLRPARTPLAQRKRWDWKYSLPNADYQCVALDTRTSRGFVGSGGDAPGLIASDPAKTDSQLVADSLPLGVQLVAHKPTDARVTILLSPAPVLGHPIVEFAQRAATLHLANLGPEYRRELANSQAELARLKAAPPDAATQAIITRLTARIAELPSLIAAATLPNAAAENDNEAWSANRPAFEDLLRRLAGFGRVVILSGDVHYAFSAQMAYFPTATGGPAARIVQFCSSALRNEDKDTRKLAGAGYEFMPTTLGWLGFDRDLSSFATDLKTALDTGIAGGGAGTDPAVRANLARVYFRLEMNDRLKRPAVIPSAHYIEPQALAKVRAIARDPTDQRDLTSWRYAIKYLSDERDVSSRTDDWTALAASLRAGSPAFGHRNRMLVGSGRSVVGQNNVGIVRFSESLAGGVVDQVTQRLCWVQVVGNAGQVTPVTMFTDHTASLAIPSSDELPEVQP